MEEAATADQKTGPTTPKSTVLSVADEAVIFDHAAKNGDLDGSVGAQAVPASQFDLDDATRALG